MSSRVKTWGAGLVCLVLLQITASLLVHRSFGLVALSDALQFLLLLSAVLSCLPGIFLHRGRNRLFWVLMGVGFSCWLTYQLVWSYVEVIQRQEVPDLFSWDALLFIHIVPMMAALALQPSIKQHDRDWRSGSLDFALLLLWWVYVYVYAVTAWQFGYADPVAYQANLQASYSVEKIALLGILGLLWYRSPGSWRKIYPHWFGASLLYSTISYIAIWAIGRQTYYSGSLYDLPLVVSIGWRGVPGLLGFRMPAEERISAKSLPKGVWAARLGMLAVFSLPIFAWFSAFDNAIPGRVRTFRLVLSLGAMLVMGGMVFLKQHFLDLELIRLLSSSRQSFQELQLLQSQLIQSEKLASFGQLVGGAAHELNNPLTAMLGYADLLVETPLQNEQRVLAEKIAQQVRRTKGLVSSLLSFAQQVPTEKVLLDMNALAQTAVKLSQPQLRARSIQVRTDLASDLPQILGDSNQLLQVCLHITNNALQAMAQTGGVLSVSTRRHDQFVQLEFADDGPGAQEPDRVFDPFYTTKPIGQGTGLGLSACYGIIQEHKGKIMCQNGPQGGAIFRIELPAVMKEATWAEAPTESSDAEVQAAATLTLPPTP